jgi:ABC-2 type transport system ATP-binding protein
MAAEPVVAAGIGLRLGFGWAVRSGSFRVGPPAPDRAPLGLLLDHPVQATAVIDLLAGMARPAYGELRVLGHDMSTIRGRAAVRRRVGVARRGARTLPGIRVRRLVEHAAWLNRQGRRDRHALAAAIIDRLGLLPWADVPLGSVPDPVARRARLAAAAVHQPELLLLDGLLDGLSAREASGLADAVRDLSRHSGIVLAGCDSDGLHRACEQVLVLADGILVSAEIGGEPVPLGTPPD